MNEVGGAWVLAPPGATPWGVLHFVGGAGFGSAPQLAYDELLATVARRCGVVVVATPFDVRLDHWSLAAGVHADADRALAECQSMFGLAAGAPIFRLGHSFAERNFHEP